MANLIAARAMCPAQTDTRAALSLPSDATSETPSPHTQRRSIALRVTIAFAEPVPAMPEHATTVKPCESRASTISAFASGSSTASQTTSHPAKTSAAFPASSLTSRVSTDVPVPSDPTIDPRASVFAMPT